MRLISPVTVINHAAEIIECEWGRAKSRRFVFHHRRYSKGSKLWLRTRACMTPIHCKYVQCLSFYCSTYRAQEKKDQLFSQTSDECMWLFLSLTLLEVASVIVPTSASYWSVCFGHENTKLSNVSGKQSARNKTKWKEVSSSLFVSVKSQDVETAELTLPLNEKISNDDQLLTCYLQIFTQ